MELNSFYSFLLILSHLRVWVIAFCIMILIIITRYHFFIQFIFRKWTFYFFTAEFCARKVFSFHRPKKQLFTERNKQVWNKQLHKVIIMVPLLLNILWTFFTPFSSVPLFILSIYIAEQQQWKHKSKVRNRNRIRIAKPQRGDLHFSSCCSGVHFMTLNRPLFAWRDLPIKHLLVSSQK